MPPIISHTPHIGIAIPTKVIMPGMLGNAGLSGRSPRTPKPGSRKFRNIGLGVGAVDVGIFGTRKTMPGGGMQMNGASRAPFLVDEHTWLLSILLLMWRRPV